MKKGLKKLTALILVLATVVMQVQTVGFAAVQREEEIEAVIENIKTIYEPGKSYFVADSDQAWVGYDNMEGDKTKSCKDKSVNNSHGRFGGLWESMGFAKFVHYSIFGNIPEYDYHCNPGDMDDKLEIIGRYASKCRYLKGDTAGDMSVENMKTLLSGAKVGDIIMVTPKKKCNLDGHAMVVTEVNEASVTVYHANYCVKTCAVTEDVITFDAFADYHCVTLLRSSDYPYAAPVPPAAVDGIKLSSNDLTLNESINVTWNAVATAESYKAILENAEGEALQEEEIPGTSTVCAFLLSNPGNYRIKLVAANVYGDSEPVFSEKFVVHNENIVTFKNKDGNVISKQRVAYGKAAEAPSVPNFEGYIFAGWDKTFDNITEPVEITAVYEKEKYTVKYYDIGGKQILKTELVEFEGKSTPPENVRVDEAYVFAGWQIGFDSKCTDYNCVTSDMTVIATQKPKQINLPIRVTIQSCERDETAKYYTYRVYATNMSAETKSFKLIGTLKSAEGKALKSVVLEETTLDYRKSASFMNKQIMYSQKATTIEFVAVAIEGDSKTGGIYSKVASEPIVDTSSWGAWSDWTDDSSEAYDHEDYESKKQYRYRNKSYGESNTNDWAAPWELYETTGYWGDWIGWYTWNPGASSTREVESQSFHEGYNNKTQYRYSRYYGWSSKGYWVAYAWKSGVCTTYQSTGWLDYALPYQASHTCGAAYGQKMIDTQKNIFWYNQETQVVPNYNSPIYVTKYRYRDWIPVYKYSKWSEWSEWSDTEISGDEMEERYVYRYRDSDNSGEPEDTTGEFITIEGNIKEATEDFNKKSAAILVYKKSNTDPTEEQLEYVGVTTIGEGNSYSFSFKPKEMPTTETGGFIVALGLEGADRVVNVDYIDVDKPKYKVTFEVDGAEYDVQTVAEGESATAPAIPEKPGYVFAGWDENLTGIRLDTVIHAKFVPSEYNLVFIDWESNTVTTQVQKYNDVIVYPELAPVEGIAKRSWNKLDEGITKVTENMIIETVAVMEEFTVTFSDENGVISTGTVGYGQKATLPEKPQKENMIFADWLGNCSYSYITCDANFTPVFVYEKTVKAPEMNVLSENGDGTYNVSLESATEGARIYYIIEEKHEPVMLMSVEEELEMIYGEGDYNPTEEVPGDGETEEVEEFNFMDSAVLYDGGEITLSKGQSIVMRACMDGMNDSIPVEEDNESDIAYHIAEVAENSIRQYRSSIEGDITITLTNNIPWYDTGAFTLCFYDQRGVLLDIIPQKIDIRPGKNTVEFRDICVSNVDFTKSDRIVLKVMTSITGGSLRPVSDVIELEIN